MKKCDVFAQNFTVLNSVFRTLVLLQNALEKIKTRYSKSRCISLVFETTNRAKLLDPDLYTESKSIRSITKNTRCCA